MKKENERAETASDGLSSKLLLGRWTAIDITLSLHTSGTPLTIESIELEHGSGSRAEASDKKTGSAAQGNVLCVCVVLYVFS